MCGERRWKVVADKCEPGKRKIVNIALFAGV